MKLNEVFFHYIRTKRPYVAMKYAMTLDGKIAAHRLGVRIGLQQQSIRAAVSGETVDAESAAVRAVAGKSLLAGEGEQPLQFTGELYEAAL